ncbi:hypothetical protein [Streptomyces sp. NPDC002851]
MSSGTTVDQKRARRRRLRVSAKVRALHVEAALDRARARAAHALEPNPDTLAAHRAAQAEAERAMRELDAMGRVFTRHDPHVRVRMRDTLATLEPEEAAHADQSKRYEVECLTHQTDPRSYSDAAEASRAAHHPEAWCEGCRQLALTPHSVRARISARKRELRRL